LAVARKVASTTGPVTRCQAVTDRAYREWSSSQVTISVPVPSASGSWVKSACQHSLGWSASNRIYDDLGRWDGSGTTSPARVRYRLIVAGATWMRWWCSRCQAIVCGPASRPCPASSFRRAMIKATVASGSARGERFGHRDRGSNAAPTARGAAG